MIPAPGDAPKGRSPARETGAPNADAGSERHPRPVVAADQNLACVGVATGRGEELSERDAVAEFVDPWMRDGTADRRQKRAGLVRGAGLAKPLGSAASGQRQMRERLDVVHEGRAPAHTCRDDHPRLVARQRQTAGKP